MNAAYRDYLKKKRTNLVSFRHPIYGQWRILGDIGDMPPTPLCLIDSAANARRIGDITEIECKLRTPKCRAADMYVTTPIMIGIALSCPRYFDSIILAVFYFAAPIA